MIAHLYNTDLANRIGYARDAFPAKGAELLYKWRGEAPRPPAGSLYLQAEAPKAAGCRTSNAASWPGSIPIPWQTDTSIGDWFYNRNWKFRPVSWVIHMLVDIVSKNGNLLLNVVQRPDGSLDPEVEQMLAQLAAWNAINGEAIFGTRPWLRLWRGRRQGQGRPLQ